MLCLFAAGISHVGLADEDNRTPIVLFDELEQHMHTDMERLIGDPRLHANLTNQADYRQFRSQVAALPEGLTHFLLIQQLDLMTSYFKETGLVLPPKNDLPPSLTRYSAIVLYATDHGIGVVSQLDPGNRIAGLDLLTPFGGFESVYRRVDDMHRARRQWRESLVGLINQWKIGSDIHRKPRPSNDSTRIISITIADHADVRQIDGLNLIPSFDLGPNSNAFDRKVIRLLRQMLVDMSPVDSAPSD